MIYLKLKKNISILIEDGNWSLHPGDMIVLKKIGVRSFEKHEPRKSTQYIHTDSYILKGFEYSTYKDFKKAFEGENDERHMVWVKCNSIDTVIAVSDNYQRTALTYSEMLYNKLNLDDIFEDVSIPYNREKKLKKILNK